jgi:acetyltransferase-like isoleucine patch superfamily enzyme
MPVKPKRLLVVGEISQMGMQVFDTTIALGYEPIVVLSPGQTDFGHAETWQLSELPEAYRSLPAVLARSELQPDLEELRLDRRLYARVSRHVAKAAQFGITNWIPLVHPSAVVSPSAEIGAGVLVGPLANIAANTRVEPFARVGRGAMISHDATLGAFCRLGPGVSTSGDVTIGEQTMVGTGAVFVNAVSVGARSLVGAGSVVTKSFPDDSLLWGNPATLRA